MKARNILWISMINIFITLVVSVVAEYSMLDMRFTQVQTNISTAVDTALRASTASEELFSEKFASTAASYGSSSGTNSSIDMLNGVVRVLNSTGTDWVVGKNYTMAAYYDRYGDFPESQSRYDNYANSLGEHDIYEWLFGSIGSDYNSYAWANSRTKLYNASEWSGLGSDRTATSNFKEFYDNIGYKIKSKVYVKERDVDTFNVVEKEIPTLTQMGVNLDTTYNKSSTITNDYLSSSVHFGKSASGIATTSYYLSPYSLGVTYVPTEVFKPLYIAHLEQLVRNKALTSGDVANINQTTGCIGTSVYEGSDVYTEHSCSRTADIVNDGEVEYDLSTVQVKVDYFYVDFYNAANYKIVNKIEGSTSQYTSSGNINETTQNSLATLPDRLKDVDTSVDKSGTRIVAKVSVKMKLHIPYISGVLQWSRHLTDTTDGENHYDIRLWDSANNQIDETEDGVWFYYSTYTTITR